MELSQSGEVIQAAVLNVTNVVKAESQPGHKRREEAEIRPAFTHQRKPIEGFKLRAPTEAVQTLPRKNNTSNDSCRCFCLKKHRD